MATKKLDHTKIKELQPAYALWKMYQPGQAPYRFQAESPEEAAQWRKKVRKHLLTTLGFQDLPAAPLAPKRIETVDRGDYIREKILLHTSAFTAMPFYLLKPVGSQGPLPVVLAFHGHGYGVKDIVGLWEDGEERYTPEGYHKDFAVELCRRGFLVAAPEISCFGERRTDFSSVGKKIPQTPPTTCYHTATLASHLGGSALGLRVFDAIRLVDYLETRTDVAKNRIGAMGISGGGLHTLFSTCADERIKACVVSGYFCLFRQSIFNVQHCACNFVPGLHQFGEIYDLAGLIAPRPMLIEAGSYDNIFPLAGVKKAVFESKKIYRLFGREKELVTDYFEGRHSISGRRAYDFLAEKLE